jgi:hypothetical protein
MRALLKTYGIPLAILGGMWWWSSAQQLRLCGTWVDDRCGYTFFQDGSGSYWHSDLRKPYPLTYRVVDVLDDVTSVLEIRFTPYAPGGPNGGLNVPRTFEVKFLDDDHMFLGPPEGIWTSTAMWSFRRKN